MSNEVVVKTDNPQVANVPAELRGQWFVAEQLAKSRLFKDVSNVYQAFVKVQAGREWGLPPHAAMNSLFIIPGSGKVSPASSLIAAKLRESKKYDYRQKKLTDEVCEIAFHFRNPDGTLGELLGVEKFDKADAKRAGTKNMDKFPRNMLFARALMNGARFYCPDLMGGSTLPYCIEEMADNFTFDQDGGVVIEAEVEVKNSGEGKRLLEEECRKKGMTLEQFAELLEVDVSEFDRAGDEEFKHFSQLLAVRKN